MNVSTVNASSNAKNEAITELLKFISDYSRLIDRQISDARDLMAKTVDQLMGSVSEINDAADFKLKKADEVLVKDGGSGFVSKSAKDVDSRYSNPANQVNAINAQISAHMATLSNLDDCVRSVLFSIMGALSVDDVVRQRLEHVTTAANSVDECVKGILLEFSKGTLNSEQIVAAKSSMAKRMFKSFTMEDEKAIFKAVLGDIKHFQ